MTKRQPQIIIHCISDIPCRRYRPYTLTSSAESTLKMAHPLTTYEDLIDLPLTAWLQSISYTTARLV